MYCDESALKALSQDALLADTKIITVYWNGKPERRSIWLIIIMISRILCAAC